MTRQSCAIGMRNAILGNYLKAVRANCFCASLLRTQIHTPRHTRVPALRNNMNNDRADGHYHSFAGFSGLRHSVTPTFLSRIKFYLQLSLHCPKMDRKSMWEVKKNSRFLSTRHQILPSCSYMVGETVVTKYELVL